MSSLITDEVFPRFQDLPDYDEPWGRYYEESGGMLSPTRHWALLADIVSVETFLRPRILVRTRFGEELWIHFYVDQGTEPTTFAWQDVKPGSCICVLYAMCKQMMDFSEGVRQENFNSVFVFRCPQARLELIAKKLHTKQCFAESCSCETGLRICGRCHVAGYCGADHKKEDWKPWHRRTCHQMEVLVWLLSQDLGSFNGYLDFRMKTLPKPTATQKEDNMYDMLSNMGAALGPTPAASRALARNLQTMADASQSGSWVTELAGTIKGNRLFDMDDAPTAEQLVHEFAVPMLTHAAERARDGMQHAVFSCGGASQLLRAEYVLALLPLWGVNSNCSSISWFIQMDRAFDKERAFQNEPDWGVVSDNPDSIMVKHTSGLMACFHDEPLLIWTGAGVMETAGELQTPHAVRVICPGPQRRDRVRTMLHERTPDKGPNLFTIWLRAPLFGNRDDTPIDYGVEAPRQDNLKAIYEEIFRPFATEPSSDQKFDEPEHSSDS
jgi:hypothetical protein